MRSDDITLTAGDAEVTVRPGNGCRLASFRLGGTELLRQGERYGCFPMVPWCGRIRDGQFGDGTQRHTMPLNSPPHAIHGTGRDTAWRTARAAADEAVFTYDLADPWPYTGRVTQRVSLAPDSLTLTMAVETYDSSFPAQAGWHPWFLRTLAPEDRDDTGGAGGTGDATDASDASDASDTDDTSDADADAATDTGTETGTGTDTDTDTDTTADDEDVRIGFSPAWQELRGADRLPTGERVEPKPGPWDDCFGMPDGVLVTLTWPGRLELTVASREQWVVVYDEQDAAVCVEPQTGPPNGLNTAPRLVTPIDPLETTTTWSWRHL